MWGFMTMAPDLWTSRVKDGQETRGGEEKGERRGKERKKRGEAWGDRRVERVNDSTASVELRMRDIVQTDEAEEGAVMILLMRSPTEEQVRRDGGQCFGSANDPRTNQAQICARSGVWLPKTTPPPFQRGFQMRDSILLKQSLAKSVW